MRVIESMTRVESYPWIVRVWRQEEELLPSYDNADIVAAVEALLNNPPGKITQDMVIEVVESMSRVNAVEVINRNTGAGPVVHTDWP